MNKNKRFIEETFPVKEVSIESAKEKNIRHGHISTLHIWWARRPLASSRATNYAALIPAPDNIEEWNQKRQFISEFSKWENSLNQTMIECARKDILAANGGKPPKVLDPFGGGGAIPLEALRLGCEVYSNDYNPVAVLIQKCTLEYPQKYGKPVKRKTNAQYAWGETEERVFNPLLEDVKKWGTWVLEEAKKEIGRFYPVEKDGFIPVGYIWARTIPCQNPACGAEIPLMRQFWLARKQGAGNRKKIALMPLVGKDKKRVDFAVVQQDVSGKWKIVNSLISDPGSPTPDFDPTNGTVARAVALCPVCGSMVDANTTRRLFQEEKADQQIIAVVLHKPGVAGKRYRIATQKDMEIFNEAEKYLKVKRERLTQEWGMDPVPDEMVPTPSHDVDRPPMYGMKVWGDLFNARQKLALITFAEKVRQAHGEMLKEGYEEEYAKAVGGYLAVSINRLADKNSALCRLIPQTEAIGFTFGRQALPMLWDYIEMNPAEHASGWNTIKREILESIKHCCFQNTHSKVTQSSATSLPHPDNFFDAVFTDPPYYDNVGYANLSDFFYVWLKRTIGDLYPELFSTPVTPKLSEIVSDINRQGGKKAAKQFFESMLKIAFHEIHRVLKPGGIAVIVYAHKSTEGWETLINSLLDSRLVMTAAWPIHTEMASKLNALGTASLMSSIYIVARKMERIPTGFYNDVTEELKQHLNKKLERLWQEGIGGADFFISAIGSAIEVFGKYEKVMDYEGTIVRADRMLEEVRKIATDFAVHRILHNGFVGEISDLTRFYVLYRWNYGSAKVPFDEARKLAQSCSIDLANEWNRPGFIRKNKEFISVLGPQDRDVSTLKDATEMIDILHMVLRLWEKGLRDDMVRFLQKSNLGESEAFYRVAQAISETLPNENKEKKLLDGFLAGKERLKEKVREQGQRRWF